MIDIVYKSKQEKILIEEVSLISFVNKEMLYDIKKYYNKIPYHNFLHALQVSNQILRLNPNNFSVIEIKSLFFAWLFHDAWHSGQANIMDEFTSLDIALSNLNDFNIKYKNKIWDIDLSIIRKAIIWTVFNKRWKLTNKFSKILWDLDIWVLWLDFLQFCYYSFPFCFELWEKYEDFLLKTEIWYFKYLININKNILITDEVNEISPNVFRNIKTYIKTDLAIKIDMLNTIQNEDISYPEFYTKYIQKIKTN